MAGGVSKYYEVRGSFWWPGNGCQAPCEAPLGGPTLPTASPPLQREWVYQPGGDRFEDRVGKILSQ